MRGRSTSSSARSPGSTARLRRPRRLWAALEIPELRPVRWRSARNTDPNAYFDCIEQAQTTDEINACASEL